jgi:hypothetical protein
MAREVTMQRVLTTGQPDFGDLTPEMQSTLAALADVEDRFEADRECLAGWMGPEAVRQKLTAHLDARHAREREPLVQRLAELHQRRMASTMVRRIRST